VARFFWELAFKPAIENANHKRAQQAAGQIGSSKKGSSSTTPSIAALGFYVVAGFFLAEGILDRNGVSLLLALTLALAGVGVMLAQKPTTVAEGVPPENEKENARRLAREKQLTALRSAVPPGPPERMRATIQINELRLPQFKQERVRHLIGEDSFVHVETGELTNYAVDMILQMTEMERAMIKQHQLDDIVLEDVPLFTEDELAGARIDDRARVDAAKDPLHKALEKQMVEMADEMKKHERRKTRIGDLLVSPFSRIFDAPHDANEYARKLKTEFLPKTRQLLDRYREYKQTETIEF
jgi:hypothetical protein